MPAFAVKVVTGHAELLVFDVTVLCISFSKDIGEQFVLPLFDQSLFLGGATTGFSPDSGEIEFHTGGGQLTVSKFECTAKRSSTILRGNFVFTPAITSRQADAANAASVGRTRLRSKKNSIVGNLQLGIRPRVIKDNKLAKTFFKDRADGYIWIDIPLDGPIDQATKDLSAKIFASLRDGGE